MIWGRIWEHEFHWQSVGFILSLLFISGNFSFEEDLLLNILGLSVFVWFFFLTVYIRDVISLLINGLLPTCYTPMGIFIDCEISVLKNIFWLQFQSYCRNNSSNINILLVTSICYNSVADNNGTKIKMNVLTQPIKW